MSPDVIIAGGGVIGTSIAFDLAKAGVKVMLLERGAIGMEATGASLGMIIPHADQHTPAPFAALMQESARLYRALADELRERTGADIGYRRAGVLEVAFDEAEDLALQRQRAWQLDHGHTVQWVGRAEAFDIEPALNPAVRAATYSPDDHQVLPLVLARTLARAAADLGAVIREHVSVDHLSLERDRVVGVVVGGERLHAGETVIACGSWSSAFAASLPIDIPVRPMRGQMVALQTPTTALRAVVSGAGGYLLTKPDGRTIVGTTVEDVGFDPRPTVDGVAELLARATALVPRLANATVESAWAGLRPGTPDGLPILGRVPDRSGVIVATGHFRNGILLAPITGELITDLLMRRDPRLSLRAFDPSRFVPHAA